MRKLDLKLEIRYKAVEIPWGEFWPIDLLLLFALWAFFPSKENKDVEKLLREVINLNFVWCKGACNNGNKRCSVSVDRC